jgi:predicted O-methyltransferase YrrM
MNDYLKIINPKRQTEVIKTILKQAEELKTPIVTEEGINFIIQLIKIGKVKKILEIGSAIGYSAIMMTLFSDAKVITIERDKQNYLFAKENIKKAGLDSKIELVLADALEYDGINTNDFDMIFIDAAKASYIKFFEKYEKFLKSNGFIVTDNLLFHGQVQDDSTVISRNRRQLINKIRNFNEFIVAQDEYDSYIYEIGDGICVSIKK